MDFNSNLSKKIYYINGWKKKKKKNKIKFVF